MKMSGKGFNAQNKKNCDERLICERLKLFQIRDVNKSEATEYRFYEITTA
jgi:hypothetical protein